MPFGSEGGKMSRGRKGGDIVRTAKALAAIFLAAFGGVAGWRVVEKLSNDALGVIIGVLCGIAASVPVALIIAAVIARRARSEVQVQPPQPPVVVIQGGQPQRLDAAPQLPAVGPRWEDTRPRRFEVVGKDWD